MTDSRRPLLHPAPTRFRLLRHLILPVLLAGVLYLFWQEWRQWTASQAASGQALQEQVQRLQQARDAQGAEVSSLRREQEALNARLEAFSHDLAPDQRREWLANETAYYLDLAEQHLQLQQDVAPALRLLELADSLLAPHADPALTQVRAGLAQDRLSLLAAQQTDRTGASLRLDALKQHALQLALPLHAGGHRAGRPSSAPDPSGQPWERGWQAFRNLITVRHYDAPVRPLLADDQRWLVQQTVYLELTQAQLALWRNQEARYRQSLADVRALMRQYAPADPAYQALQQELAALATMRLPEIPVTLPRARQALSALKTLHPQQQPAGSTAP